MPFEMDRSSYAGTYGPTVGDRIRLGDTNLVAEVEQDSTNYGDEALLGWGKNIRAGMLMAHRRTRASELDYLIAGVVVIDPVLGVRKGSIGVKDGLIAGIGRAGSGDIMDGVDLEIGANTAIINGIGMIATPGGVDSHVHLVTPKIVDTALAAGLTTLIGGGIFDNGRLILRRTFEAFEHLPVNLAIQATGSSTSPFPMEESIEGGACGFKIHEDTGAYGNVIDGCLRVAEQADVSVALHTDGLQESTDVRGTIDAIGGRAVHAYHIEGAGGGHAPDLLTMAGVDNIIPSSTTPTIPYTVGTFQEHFAMTAICHMLDLRIPSDAAALDDRLRRRTMAAEDVLHDLGAIPIINSDSQGMGRIGEVITRTWQLAHKMKAERGAENPMNDNDRILRYMAKYTINPAITHGIADYVGSLQKGKMADVVLWWPAFFGIKPELVMKGGFVAWGPMGEGNATVPGAEPTSYGPMFGGIGNNPGALSALFVSRASIEGGLGKRLRTARTLRPVTGVRAVRKSEYLLSGIGKCGNCGGPMVGKAGYKKKDGTQYRNYWCSRAQKSRAACSTYNGHAVAPLEKTILEYLGKFTDPKLVREHLDTAKKRDVTARSKELNRVEKAIAGVAGDFLRHLELHKQGILNDEEFRFANESLRGQKDLLEARKLVTCPPKTGPELKLVLNLRKRGSDAEKETHARAGHQQAQGGRGGYLIGQHGGRGLPSDRSNRPNLLPLA